MGVIALALQFALPAVHPPHTPPDGPHSGTAHQVVAHDALACPLCAAIAQGRASALDRAPALGAPATMHAPVVAPAVSFLAAPTLSGPAPRGPPAVV